MSNCRYECGGKCRAKNYKPNAQGMEDCTPMVCTLRQTEEMYLISLHRAWDRFRALPISQQADYRKLYYHGRYPWEVRRG